MEHETRVAVIAIIAEQDGDIETMNGLLHQYSAYIIGRMGIPHVQEHLNVISIVLSAPEEKINALSGKLGMCKGLSSKVLYGKSMKKS